jgi:hypothetical protein
LDIACQHSGHVAKGVGYFIYKRECESKEWEHEEASMNKSVFEPGSGFDL